MAGERVVIAEVLRPRGNQGELLAKSQTDVPGRIEALRNAKAHLRDGADVQVDLVDAWRHKSCWVLKFAGVDSVSAAERFRGADLWVPFANRGALAEGDFFQTDLIGCSVFDGSAAKRVGTVKGWQQYGAPPLMEVAVDGREVLIPFIAQLCEVDLSDRTIRVDLPQGLLDL